MIYAIIFLLCILIFAILFFRLYLHFIPKNRVTILMYHSVQPQSENPLVIPVKNLEEQLEFLSKNKFNTLFFRDLDNKTSTNKNIILTFDDGYKDNLEYLLPLLKKNSQKAVIFVNTAFVNDANKMSFEEMKNVDSEYLEIALHTHSHKNLTEISLAEAEKEISENIIQLTENQIEFSKVLAYPYGRFPKNNSVFYEMLKKIGIKYALRIGNKNEYFPFKNPYQICRIGIDGNDSLQKFKLKLFFGKLKI